MITCLHNRIGIIGCDADLTPTPQLLINSLPGVTLTKVSSLANDEQKTYLGVWDDIVLRTLLQFELLIKAELNKCHRITKAELVDCIVCENVALFDYPLWYLHGVQLMIEITSTDTLNRYTTIDLDKAERLKTEFYQEFASALSDAVKSIDLESSECFEDECVEELPGLTDFVVQLP